MSLAELDAAAARFRAGQMGHPSPLASSCNFEEALMRGLQEIGRPLLIVIPVSVTFIISTGLQRLRSDSVASEDGPRQRERKRAAKRPLLLR